MPTEDDPPHLHPFEHQDRPPKDPDVTVTASLPGGGSVQHIVHPSPAPRSISIDGYENLRELGRGGQGIVYQAVQKSTDRNVAIKVLLEGPAASESARRRFEREVDLVAHLKHPNIITVFDSGVTADGRHYFVMDYAPGLPVTQYIKDRRLNLEEALNLFACICDAVSHAHQKGVIHRDLKPGNILVDAEGVLHVLDFGLAKAVNEQSETFATLTGQVLGTLPYMSPEQTRGNPDLIDTRTDVYALGVILYEMLTGAYPYPVIGELAEVLRHISQTAPRRLTQSWTRESGIGSSTRVRRRTRCPINDEVETIALKALSKECERRYQSAGELAKDIRHYLAHEPIEAKRDSGIYLLKKAIWRHRVAVGVAAGFVILLAGFAVSMTIARNRAVVAEADARTQRNDALAAKEAFRAERDRAVEAEKDAQATLSFLRERVLAAARPLGQNMGLGHDVTIRAAIDAASPNVASSFEGRPKVEAFVRRELGMTYAYLGEHQQATSHTERALALMKATLGPEHPDTLACMSNLASCYGEAGRYKEAVSLHEETLKLKKVKLGENHPDTLHSMNNLAMACFEAGRLNDGLDVLQQIVQTLGTASLDSRVDETLTLVHNVAQTCRTMGPLDDAISLFETVLPQMKSRWGPEHPNTLACMDNLASAYDFAQRGKDAVLMFEAALKLKKARLGPDHPNTVLTLNNLAGAYSRLGRHSDAVPLLEESLRILKAKLGAEHPDVLRVRNNLANIYGNVGRMPEALALSEETYELARTKLGLDHLATLSAMNDLAMNYRAAGRLNDALPLIERTLELRLARLGPEHADTFVTMGAAASVYESAARWDKAVPLREQVLEVRKKTLGADHPETVKTRGALAIDYIQTRRFAEAAELYAQMLQTSSDNHILHIQYAALLAYVSDPTRYRDHCNAMLKRFGDTKDRSIADRVAKASLFLPNDGVDLTAASKLADFSVADPQFPFLHYHQFTKALAEYRNGRFKEAAQWAEKSVTTTRGSKALNCFIEASLLLSMAQHRLGQTTQSGALLQEAITALPQIPQPGQQGFVAGLHDWIMCTALRSEAESLIGQPATRSASPARGASTLPASKAP